MKNKIQLQELENPINSDFKDESTTAAGVVIGVWAVQFYQLF